jgi:Cft2 family RNA processing exonuclease
VKICIKCGAHQIGGSCVEIAADNGKKIMIDIGMPLSEDFVAPSQKFMPDVKNIYQGEVIINKKRSNFAGLKI